MARGWLYWQSRESAAIPGHAGCFALTPALCEQWHCLKAGSFHSESKSQQCFTQSSGHPGHMGSTSPKLAQGHGVLLHGLTVPAPDPLFQFYR